MPISMPNGPANTAETNRRLIAKRIESFFGIVSIFMPHLFWSQRNMVAALIDRICKLAPFGHIHIL